MRIDGIFTDRVFDWLDVPREWRPRVWEGVCILHDLARHDLRGYPHLCLHPEFPLADFVERCPDCRARLKCSTCGSPFEFHDPCENDAESPGLPGERVKYTGGW